MRNEKTQRYSHSALTFSSPIGAETELSWTTEDPLTMGWLKSPWVRYAPELSANAKAVEAHLTSHCFFFRSRRRDRVAMEKSPPFFVMPAEVLRKH